MTDPFHLFDRENVCPVCNGEKVIYFVDRLGAIRSEVCSECAGLGFTEKLFGLMGSLGQEKQTD